VWRVIYTDGRPHSKDPNPTYLGESIGHWEGDTLVTDVIGFNERTWLDQDGHPHGEALHIMEKFTRLNECRCATRSPSMTLSTTPSRGLPAI